MHAKFSNSSHLFNSKKLLRAWCWCTRVLLCSSGEVGITGTGMWTLPHSSFGMEKGSRKALIRNGAFEKIATNFIRGKTGEGVVTTAPTLPSRQRQRRYIKRVCCPHCRHIGPLVRAV